MSEVTVVIEGKSARVTLDNPSLRNALDFSMIEQLHAAVRELASNTELRSMVLNGKGEHFCAGADINWMRDSAKLPAEENERQAKVFADTLLGLSKMPFPVVVLAKGNCFGGGAGLCCVADVTLASADARICFSEARLGLTPATISPYVVAAMGSRQAKRLFLTGEIVDAGEALRLGIFHRVHEEGRMELAVGELLAQIGAMAPGTVTANRLLLEMVSSRPIDSELCTDTAHALASRRQTTEAQEGLAAFLDKRKAAWIDD